jgi:hypothetical protein
MRRLASRPWVNGGERGGTEPKVTLTVQHNPPGARGSRPSRAPGRHPLGQGHPWAMDKTQVSRISGASPSAHRTAAGLVKGVDDLQLAIRPLSSKFIDLPPPDRLSVVG